MKEFYKLFEDIYNDVRSGKNYFEMTHHLVDTEIAKEKGIGHLGVLYYFTEFVNEKTN